MPWTRAEMTTSSFRHLYTGSSFPIFASNEAGHLASGSINSLSTANFMSVSPSIPVKSRGSQPWHWYIGKRYVHPCHLLNPFDVKSGLAIGLVKHECYRKRIPSNGIQSSGQAANKLEDCSRLTSLIFETQALTFSGYHCEDASLPYSAQYSCTVSSIREPAPPLPSFSMFHSIMRFSTHSHCLYRSEIG